MVDRRRTVNVALPDGRDTRLASVSERADALLQRLEPGSRVERSWELEGGVSARVVAVRLDDSRTFVVRFHGDADLARDPDVAQHELALLEAAQAAGIPVPAPRHAEPGALVVDFVEGEPGTIRADPVQLADVLARIHRVEPPPFLGGDGVLLHGDFWPGNTLWRDGRLVAVVDWEDAAVGDPLADVANARLELAWSVGFDAMEEFTSAYAARADVDLARLPAWDIRADARLTARLSSWGLDPAEERRMLAARYRFVAQAFARLADLQG
jgi:aminoglycoside phosphotransferase (APT) family kinase protein